jgi:serine protease Do
MTLFSSIRGRSAAVLGLVLAICGAVPLAKAQREEVTRMLEFDRSRSYLGIEMEDVTADNMGTYSLSSERGVIVRSVEQGSPAEAAALQPKDVILEYAGTPVFSTMQMRRLVQETPVGRKVDIAVDRAGKKLVLSARIAERKGSLQSSQRFGDDVPFGGRGGRFFEFRAPDGRNEFFYNVPVPPPFPDGVHSLDRSGRPRLGVTLETLTDQMAEFLGVAAKKGVLVTVVTAGSPAAGKLKAGDVIVRANGRPVASPQDLVEAVDKAGSGGKLDLGVVRDKKEIPVVVELAREESKPARGGYRL